MLHSGSDEPPGPEPNPAHDRPAAVDPVSSTLLHEKGLAVLAAFLSVPAELRAILAHRGWTLHEACGTAEVARFLHQCRVPVIICDRSVAGGTWRDILQCIAPLPCAPRLIVTAADADDVLWADVLNLGGYDVLAQPFREQEVIRVVASAFRRWAADRGGDHTTRVD